MNDLSKYVKEKCEKLECNNSIRNELEDSKRTLLVREVAKLAYKVDVIIGEKRLWQKLREWGLILQKSTEPKQLALERGYFEVREGTKEINGKIFTYRTTRVTSKGEIYIIERLLKEKFSETIG